jgi:hypothetical protein
MERLVLVTLLGCGRIGFDATASPGDGGPGGDASDVPPSSLCGGVWCVEDSNVGDDLSSVWGTPGELWAVGGGGTIIRGTASGWTPMSTAVQVNLRIVFGTSATDIWAFGDGGGGHYDGTAWTAFAPTAAIVLGLWGASPTDWWAVGDPTTILHWDGAQWSPVASGTPERLTGVWGSSANAVWAVGRGGTIVFWDGAAWTPVPSGTTQDLESISGVSADDIWVAGAGGTVVHWDGVAWTASEVGAFVDLNAVFHAARDDAWAVAEGGVLFHWDGTAWTEPPSGSGQFLEGVWGLGPNDIYVVGANGTILHGP